MAKQEKSSGWKSVTSVFSEAPKGVFSRVYLFTGEEKFLIDKAIRVLKDNVISPGAENVDYYLKDASSSEVTLDDLQSLVGTPPFISKRRMTVIRNSGFWANRAPSSAKDQEKWKSVIQSVPEFAIVLFIEEKVDKRKKALVDAVSSVGSLIEVDLQNEDVLKTWILQRCGKYNISMGNDCISSLISRVNSSMRSIDNEMQKIILYCEYTKTTRVTMELLDKLCVPDVHASVFQMTDAIGQRKPGRALEIFKSLIILKEPIAKIRLMLARHIRHLICAKELNDAGMIASRLKVQPFVARNLVSQAKGFSIEQLERIYNLCFESDQWVKNGRMDEQLSMEVLLTASGKI